MKHILPYILFTLLLFSCTERANETVSQSTSTAENSEYTDEYNIDSSQIEEDALSYPDSIDHEWLEEDYQVPPWGGATDVTQIPEYIYTKLYWETTKNDWPTIEELLDKYDLEYDEINAVNLNYAGMEVYDREEYLDAIALFRWGTLKDPSYVYPHYNLACSAALLLEEILETDPVNFDQELYLNKYGYYWAVPFLLLDELFSHLAITLYLDKDYLAKMHQDKDLKILHSMQRYKSFMQFTESGDLWPYYGFYIEDLTLSEYTYMSSICIDGRIYSDSTNIDHFYNNGSIIFTAFIFLDIEGTIRNESIFNHFSEGKDDQNIYVLKLWKDLIQKSGYLPKWDDSFYSYMNGILSFECNLQPQNYIVSVQTSLNAVSIYEVRSEDPIGPVGPLKGFNQGNWIIPLPQVINDSYLIFSEVEKLHRTDANQYWNSLIDDK